MSKHFCFFKSGSKLFTPFNKATLFIMSVTWYSKLVLEVASLLEHLDSVIIGISNYNVFINAQTEAVRRVKLSLARS